MDTLTRRVFIFLLYFAQGGEFFLFHWFPNAYRLYDSGIVQPAGNIVDPSVIFSISLAFVFFTLIFSVTKRVQMLLPIVLLGVLPGIKIYTGLAIYIATVVVAVIELMKKKIGFAIIIGVSACISALIYLPFNFRAGSLIWNPFLLFRHFMEGDRVFTSFQWALKLQFYQAHHTAIRIVYLYGIALLLYFIPPLGIRCIAFFKIRSVFHKKFYTLSNIFLGVAMITLFLIPILFIQSVAVFNTVQFYWLLWILLLIPTSFSLTSLTGQTSVKTLVMCAILVLLSVPAFNFVYLIYNTPPLQIDKTTLDFSQKVKNIVPKSNTILIVNRVYLNNLYVDAYGIPLFATLIERPLYYEPEHAEFAHIDSIEKERTNVIDTTKNFLTHCSPEINTILLDILHQAHIQDVILTEDAHCVLDPQYFKITLQEGNYSLIQVH